MEDKSPQNVELANSLVRQLIKENRSAKRWKNIRFFLGLAFVAFLTLFFISSNHTLVDVNGDNTKGYAAVIKLDGMIGPGQGFSAEEVLPLLKDAFTDESAQGVILDINSGGGTPVQASIIHDAIIKLKNQYHKKVIVVGEDMLASGAYYVAVAADKIYVNPNTITGSIGVIMKGFGFPDVIKKIGVERRVYASGEYKDRLDSFLPQNKEDIDKIRQVIGEVHNNFNQVVLQGRAGKLHADAKTLFTGDFWSGQTALTLGLVDGLGNLLDVLQNEFHVSRYKDYSQNQAMLKNLISQLGASLDLALGQGEMKVLTQME